MSEQKRVYKNADGIRRTLIWDDNNPEQAIVHTQQVMDEILDGAARFRDIPQPGAFKKVATCPVEVYERSIREDWDDADWAKWLNDPDNALLRTWNGRV